MPNQPMAAVAPPRTLPGPSAYPEGYRLHGMDTMPWSPHQTPRPPMGDEGLGDPTVGPDLPQGEPHPQFSPELLQRMIQIFREMGIEPDGALLSSALDGMGVNVPPEAQRELDGGPDDRQLLSVPQTPHSPFAQSDPPLSYYGMSETGLPDITSKLPVASVQEALRPGPVGGVPPNR